MQHGGDGPAAVRPDDEPVLPPGIGGRSDTPGKTQARRNTRVPFVPPKPNEFDSTTSIAV